jgi:hypothetical protein
MKRLRLALAILAALALGLPPIASAEVICNTYTFRALTYYQDCDCWACGGWSLFNCTECVDTETGGACWTNGSDPCEGPFYRH